MAAFIELLTPRATRGKRWHRERRKGVTASEIAAVAGLSPHDSPWSLWMRKRGYLPPRPDNEWMRWGRIHEPNIIAEFLRAHPEFHGRRLGLCASRERPWQMATPDLLLTESQADDVEPVAGLEVKCEDSMDRWGEPGTDEIPDDYRCQVLWSMDVFGVDQWFVAVLFRGKLYREYVIVRDPIVAADILALREQARDFLSLLAKDEPPELDAHEATRAGLTRLHAGEPIDRAAQIPIELAQDFRQAKAAVERAEADYALASNRLLAAMGHAKRAVDPNGELVATRVVFDQGRVDVKRLRQERPDIAREFKIESEVHQLRPPSKPRRSHAAPAR